MLIKKYKKFFIITTIILSLGSTKSTYANNTVNTYKDKLSSTTTNIKETENKLNSIKKQQQKTQTKVAEIINNIDSIQIEIDLQLEKLEKLEAEKLEKELELKKLQKEYTKNYRIFEKQLVSTYTSSFSENYNKVIFESKSVSDFIIGSTYYEYIIDNKDIKLNNLDKNMKKQENLIKDIEINQKNIEEVKNDLDKKRDSLESQQIIYQDQLESLQMDANELEAILDAQYKEANIIEEKINSLQNSLYADKTTTNNNTQSNNSTPTSSKGFRWPTSSKRVTSKYGYRIHPVTGTRKMHTGIDIGQGMGAPIYASNSGTIIYADWRGGYGKTIIIDHGSYMSTLYAHLNKINVRVGQKVSKGQQIGTMGSTGMSTGPHLHFEVRKNGKHQNPMDYIK